MIKFGKIFKSIIMFNIWESLPDKAKDLYIKRLKAMCSLSGLFKEQNGSFPFIGYRNHEMIFIKSFQVQDIARKDCSFDVIANIKNKNIGIGLKTWINKGNNSYQKIAEFNTDSHTLRNLFQKGQLKQLIFLLAKLRNQRIDNALNLYKVDYSFYHNLIRSNNSMFIVEEEYSKINAKSLEITQSNDSSVSFTDGLNDYKFTMSKSTLFKKFDTSEDKRIITFETPSDTNAFEVLDAINVNFS